MAITPLPDPPSRSDPANFPERADAFMAALPGFATEANVLAQQMDEAAETAEAYKDSAGSSATAANASAANALLSETHTQGSATAAAQARTDAEGARDLAKDWASKASGTVDGTPFLSAKQYAELAAQGAGLPIYGPNAIPTQDMGPIFVIDVGHMKWVRGAYAPNNLPQLHRSGGALAYGTSNVTLGPGKWRSLDDSVDIVLTSSITKTLQSSGSWAAGNNGNGVFSGVKAQGTWYHFFVIANDSTGAVDAGFDTSITAANIPSGWTAYRRVGSIRTNASGNVLPYIVRGPHFRLLTPIRVYQAAAPTPAWTSFNLDQVPPDVRTFAEIHTAVSTSNGFFSLNIAPPGTAYSASVNDSAVSFVMSTIPADNAVSRVLTGLSRDILIRADQSGTLTVDVLGYEDFLED